MNPLDFAEGAHERFNIRRRYFRNDKKKYPELRHAAFWLLHNCVAHPILAVSPSEPAVGFHALTSAWLAHEFQGRSGEQRLFLSLPKIPSEKRRAWVFHNLVAHMAIGLVPCKATFDFHDKTAQAMDVPDWV